MRLPPCVSFHGNGDFQVDWRWGEWHVGTIIGMKKKCVKSDKKRLTQKVSFFVYKDSI